MSTAAITICSLSQTRQAAYDLVSLTNELRDVVNNEARPDLEATLTCQSAVTNVLQEALATATRLCSIEGPILQSVRVYGVAVVVVRVVLGLWQRVVFSWCLHSPGLGGWGLAGYSSVVHHLLTRVIHLD